MAADLFDMTLRAQRRDRAVRLGSDTFLLDRAFDDCMDSISSVQRRFTSALLIGSLNPEWPGRLAAMADETSVLDPGPLAAAAAGGVRVIEDGWSPPASRFDLCIAVGTLDTVNDLPLALRLIRQAMRSDGFLIGAVAGGDTLPVLRAAMIAADQEIGAASPHVHPRIEAPALAQLLSASGFAMPVVDIDRVRLNYGSLSRLVGDLRRMGATNILRSRSRRPLTRAAKLAAEHSFFSAGDGQSTVEQIEILHFAAWTSAPDEGLPRVNPDAA